MTLNRYAKRRDANEPELVAAARRIGLKVWITSELGDWLVQYGKLQRLVEVKTEDGKLSESQAKRKQQGLNAYVVRTVDDVLELHRQMRMDLMRLAR